MQRKKNRLKESFQNACNSDQDLENNDIIYL